MNKIFEQNKNSNRGWFEERENIVTDKGVKSVAPRHHEVAWKKNCPKNVITSPVSVRDRMQKETDKDIIVKFGKNIEKDEQFDEKMDKFFDENPDAECNYDKNLMKINSKYRKAIVDFLAENHIKATIVDADEEKKDSDSRISKKQDADDDKIDLEVSGDGNDIDVMLAGSENTHNLSGMHEGKKKE